MSSKMKPIILDDNVHTEHPNDIKEWIDDTKYWPLITYGDIYKYFIESKTVDGKAMKGVLPRIVDDFHGKRLIFSPGYAALCRAS